VISYSVTRKTQEIGVRMLLGASAGRVIVAGTIVSVVSARLIASLLFTTLPWDATSYRWMVLLLVAVAFVSGYMPARRAFGVEPMSALRIQ
jgi:ABC-type antimicrobial peptide transport system permease subunit